MHYDPIKKVLGNFFGQSTWLRKLFYGLLDLLLLRTWHVHLELRKWNTPKKNNASILDAGAGFGQYTYWLHSQNPSWSILSVDVKEDQVADCNNFFQRIGAKNVMFRTADLVTFRQPDSFDLALSVDVMEHILEDTEVFRNIVASLHIGGMLLISTPSDQGGSDADGEDGTSFIEEHVRNGYNIQDIQEKLKAAGFSKVEARYSYGKPGQISWRLAMKYPITLLGVSKLFFVVLPFYYIVVYPIAFVLNYLDTTTVHSTGTGLIVKAWK